MIKLTKLKLSSELIGMCQRWLEELKRCANEGVRPNENLLRRFRHADLKEKLISETSGKCAYCESKLRHICPGDVEHIIPKSVKPENRFEWKNLTLACPECNNAKRDYYSEAFPLVDPYEDDPEKEIVFAGAEIQESECSPKGETTTRELHLNRKELREERARHLAFLGEKLKGYHRAGASEYEQHVYHLNIWDFAQKDQPYAGMCRQYIRNRGVPPDPKNRPLR